MIKQVWDNESYFIVTDELLKVPNAMISTDMLFRNMANNPHVSTHLYFNENDEVKGGVVLNDVLDITGKHIFFVMFQFRDVHFPELAEMFTDYVNKLAKEKGATKIVFTSSRKDSVTERATKKLGFKKSYSVFEKEVI